MIILLSSNTFRLDELVSTQISKNQIKSIIVLAN
jgi:hypothetical protein